MASLGERWWLWWVGHGPESWRMGARRRLFLGADAGTLVRRIAELLGPPGPRRDRAARVLQDRLLAPNPLWRRELPGRDPMVLLRDACESVPASQWPALMERLDDEDRAVARVAARVCGLSGRDDAAEAVAQRLVARLEAEPDDARVPVAGAFVMAALDSPCEVAIEGLELALRERPAHWEHLVPGVLARMGSVPALMGLARFCFDDDAHRWKEHRVLREEAIDVVGIDALLPLAEDPDPAVRLLVLEARARLRPPGTRAAARSALADDERLVRIRAATLLARLDDDASVEALREATARAGRRDERHAMLLARHQLGDPTAAEQVRAQQAAAADRARTRQSRAAAEGARRHRAFLALFSKDRPRRQLEGDELWLHWLESFLDGT